MVKDSNNNNLEMAEAGKDRQNQELEKHIIKKYWKSLGTKW